MLQDRGARLLPQALSSKVCSFCTSASALSLITTTFLRSLGSLALCGLSTGTVLSTMLWDGELMFQVPRLHKFICYFSRASFFSFLLCYFKELMRIPVLQDKKGPFFTSSTKWQPFWLQDFQTLVCSGKWHMAVVALLLADTVKNQKTLKGFISVMRMGREPF